MTIVPLRDEEGRIAALYRYDLLNGAHNVLLERVAKLARTALGTAVSGITMIDRDEVHFRAVQGMPARPLKRSESLCDGVVANGQPTIIVDLASDLRFANHPVRGSRPEIGAY